MTKYHQATDKRVVRTGVPQFYHQYDDRQRDIDSEVNRQFSNDMECSVSSDFRGEVEKVLVGWGAP